ncbi:MAG: hypothetical protein J7524_05990 [Roseofilum sp. Belize BBD 4]|uniref:hypothetical protein n=1 Tax=Roseofilum sp. Belize BBD 4 TaxID=2821500 RepID=UPI001B0A6259|nr:hypothetical protein [Roseofilum sp. Belize BBD 4]MBP0032706.1 hypothetical protein [Roseofilum sp. Belize BBD 4]
MGKLNYYESLQADFIDCPGFQYPSIALDYLDGQTLSPRNQGRVKHDIEAIPFIKNSNVVLYVASLSTVPDDTHEDEIDVVTRINGKVVGIVNQYHKNFRGSSREEVDNRCKLWTDLLYKKGVSNVIVFDAHWDYRDKEKKIYDAVYQLLEDRLKDDFYSGLKQFKERMNSIKRKSYELAAESLEILQAFKKSFLKKEYQDNYSECVDEFQRVVYKETIGLIKFVSDLYSVAAEYPNESISDLLSEIRKTNRMDLYQRLNLGASASTVMAGIGAIFGAVLGAVVTGSLSGGLATVPGAIEGAKIFSALGVAGTLRIFSDDGDRIKIVLPSEKLEDCFKMFCSIIWGIQYNGFGRGKDWSEIEIKEMASIIEKITTDLSSMDWTTVNRSDIVKFAELVFSELEKSPL